MNRIAVTKPSKHKAAPKNKAKEPVRSAAQPMKKAAKPPKPVVAKLMPGRAAAAAAAKKAAAPAPAPVAKAAPAAKGKSTPLSSKLKVGKALDLMRALAGKVTGKSESKVPAKGSGKAALKVDGKDQRRTAAAVEQLRRVSGAVPAPKAPPGKVAPKLEPAKDAERAAGPLLDLSDAAVKKMIKLAKKRGYVTYDQLNEVMPSEEVTSEKIEDVLSMLNEMGINVVEAEEAEETDDDDDDEEESG